MRQMTLAAAGFERYAKSTRRAVFLAEMERVVPWPAVRADRAVLSQSRQRPPAGRGGADAGPNRMLDDHRRKAVAAVRYFSHHDSLPRVSPPSYPVILTRPSAC